MVSPGSVSTSSTPSSRLCDRAETTSPSSERSRFYGRRHGHRLSALQRQLLAQELPRRDVILPPAGVALDPAILFSPAVTAVWLEIGFGSGEHLLAQAEANPGVGLIGCEPYINGIAAALRPLSERPDLPVRLTMQDARAVLWTVADRSLARVFLLFPDPWPKRRHHKRRFVQPAALDQLARAMIDGGEFRFATDHREYARWTLGHVLRHGAFEWLARSPNDWRSRPADWPATRYERKAERAGRAPIFLRFRRRPRLGA